MRWLIYEDGQIYLDKLPKEDGEDKRIFGIRDIGHHIDMGMTSEMFCEVVPEDWLMAFQAHHNETTRGSNNCKSFEDPNGRAIRISSERSRVKLLADNGHHALKFWMRGEDEESRDIVYGFLERLVE